jgi:hypothetical protein
MADNLSDYAENKILDHSLGTTMPTQLYLALYTAAPSDAGGGTEVSGTGYARQAVDFDASSGGATQNAAEILFPVAGASWGTVTHVGLFDASSAGNLIWHGALSASKAIDTNDQFKIADGDLDISIS